MGVGGLEVEVPGEPARALIVVLHMLNHGLHATRPAEDLRRALARVERSTWEASAALAAELGATAGFAAGLRVLPEGTALADSLGLPDEASVEARLRTASPPHTALGFQRLVEAPGLLAKARLLGRELVPTAAFMRIWSPLARRGPLGLAAAYLWRPLWLLLQARGGLRALRRARAGRTPPGG
jgi:hypothetical protein